MVVFFRWLTYLQDIIMPLKVIDRYNDCADFACSSLAITMKSLTCGFGAGTIHRWLLQQTVHCWRYSTAVRGRAVPSLATPTAL